MTTTPPVARPGANAMVLVPLLVGAAVAVALGVYGREHDPSGKRIFSLFFTGTINLKVWFATFAVVFGAFQVLSALRIYGRISVPREMPAWLPTVHRLSGLAAFLLTIPVAYHCLWALGFGDETTRRLVHSVAGVFFYGAFVAKILIVRWRSLPGWALPLAGGAVFSALVVVWYSSSLWYFRTQHFPAF